MIAYGSVAAGGINATQLIIGNAVDCAVVVWRQLAIVEPVDDCVTLS